VTTAGVLFKVVVELVLVSVRAQRSRGVDIGNIAIARMRQMIEVKIPTRMCCIGDVYQLLMLVL